MRSYWRGYTPEQRLSYKWTGKVHDAVIKKAYASAGPPGYLGGQTADCPLCHGGSYTPYQDGFKLPIGLERHLQGWGHARQCPVLHEIEALAREYWDGKFAPAEAEAERKKAEEKAQRLKTETLYRVEAMEEPVLYEDGVRSWDGGPRTSEELQWAEQRLASLGFTRRQEERVVSWVDDRAEGYMVYADPRTKKRVRFYVYPKPLPRKRRGHRAKRGYFELLDTLKNDLPGKYSDRLAGGLAQIGMEQKG